MMLMVDEIESGCTESNYYDVSKSATSCYIEHAT